MFGDKAKEMEVKVTHRKFLALAGCALALATSTLALAQAYSRGDDYEAFGLDGDKRTHFMDVPAAERANGVYLECTAQLVDGPQDGDNGKTEVFKLFLSPQSKYYMRVFDGRRCDFDTHRLKMDVQPASYTLYSLFHAGRGQKFTDIRISRTNGRMTLVATRDLIQKNGYVYRTVNDFTEGTCRRIEPLKCPALETQF